MAVLRGRTPTGVFTPFYAFGVLFTGLCLVMFLAKIQEPLARFVCFGVSGLSCDRGSRWKSKYRTNSMLCLLPKTEKCFPIVESDSLRSVMPR